MYEYVYLKGERCTFKEKGFILFFLLLLLFYPFCSTIDVDQDNNTDSREAN